MKIATWNLERGRRLRSLCLAQAATIAALDADVVVLTEPPSSYRNGVGVVTSPVQRPGPWGPEAWVAVIGRAVAPVPFEVPFERMAVVAKTTRAGRTLIVYGAVLPWLGITSHAPYLIRPGESSLAVFERVLAEQAADVAELRRQYGAVVWAGDFNQTLMGANLGGSAARRAVLAKTLSALRLVAWNQAAAHAQPEMCALDLICGPMEMDLLRQGRVDPVARGIVMSDHAGYWVEI